MFVFFNKIINADDDLLLLIKLTLVTVRGVGDLTLEKPCLNCRNDSTENVNFFEIGFRFTLHLIGERLDKITAGKRVDGVRHPYLVSDNLLRAKRNLHRFFRRKSKSLIHRICVEGLSPAQYTGKRFVCGANDIILRLLRC